MERIAIQVFLNGLRDHETRQTLILIHPNKLVDVLVRALKFDKIEQNNQAEAKYEF